VLAFAGPNVFLDGIRERGKKILSSPVIYPIHTAADAMPSSTAPLPPPGGPKTYLRGLGSCSRARPAASTTSRSEGKGLFSRLNFSFSVFQIHRDEKEFRCDVCNRHFRHKNSLVRHLAQHAGERPHKCAFCTESFSSLAKHRDHVKRRHPAIHEQLTAAVAAQRAAQPATTSSSTRQYQPIAPAPANSSSVAARAQQLQQRRPLLAPAKGGAAVISQVLPAAAATSVPTPSATTYLAQGPNGAVYLITNPVPQPQQQMYIAGGAAGALPVLLNAGGQQFYQQQQPLQQPLVFGQGNVLQVAGGSATLPASQPIYIQPPAANVALSVSTTTGLPQPAQATTPSSSSAMSSLLSPREAAMLTAATPEAPTPEPTAEPLPGLRSDDAECLEISNADGSVTLAPAADVAFEMESDDAAGVTLRTENGRTLKLDILERAILEIPNLDEMSESSASFDAVDASSIGSLAGPTESRFGRRRGVNKIEEGADRTSHSRHRLLHRAGAARGVGGGAGQPGQISPAAVVDDSIEDEEEEEEEEVVEPWTPEPPPVNQDREEEEVNEVKEMAPASKHDAVHRLRSRGRPSAASSSSPSTVRRAASVCPNAGRATVKQATANTASSSSTDHSAEAAEVEAAEESPYACQRCGRRYRFANFLRLHQQKPC
jgi:hypothetical protein